MNFKNYGSIKNFRILIFTMLYFLKINKEKFQEISDMIYSSWDIECDRQKLVIMGHFLPFYTPPPKKPKKQNFEKMKKVTGDVIIYTSVPKTTIIWGTVPVIRNLLSFRAIFNSFTPLTIRKIKILKKWKKLLEMSSF